MLLLKPIKKPRLKGKEWYKLNVELQDASNIVNERRRMSIVKSITSYMSKMRLPGSENARVLPDRRKCHGL